MKASWEAAEPGRAEKAAKSRQKYLALMKQKRGEKLTEEEAEALKEKRERVKKKDLEEAAAPGKKAGKQAAKAPAKASKAPAAAEKAAVEEEDESARRVLPTPVEHINSEIVSYLNHFKSKRLIKVICKDKKAGPRTRSDEEKE